MGAILHVLRKKIHYIGPVTVEGKFFRKVGQCFHQFFTWVDRKLGYFGRWILWKKTRSVPNQIMFFPFSHSVSCNLKYISDELIRRQAPVEIYWSVTNTGYKISAMEILSKDMEIPDRVKKLCGGGKIAGRKLSYWQEMAGKEKNYPASALQEARTHYEREVAYMRKKAAAAALQMPGSNTNSQIPSAPDLAVISYEEPPTLEELEQARQIEELKAYIKEHVHLVKTNLYAYFHAAATSKVLITNSLLGDKFYPFPTRKEQIVLQTWHGSLGIKRFDPAHYNTNVTWPVAAKRSGKLTTHIISNSDFEDKVYRETFWKKTPILHFGHARNDIFFEQSSKTREYLRHSFCVNHKLSDDTHFALYAPTFRDDHNFAVYDLDAKQTVRALEERFGGSWKLLVRYHDNDKKTEAKKNKVKSADVIDVTKYPDMQSLLAFTDCGITDYSSWIYDYVLLKKPGFIFAMDRDHYNNERGFYFKLEDTPFPVAVNSDELEANILSFDEELFQKRVLEFLSDKGCIDDGNASRRIADWVLEQCGVDKWEEKS